MPTLSEHYPFIILMHIPPDESHQGVIRIIRYRFKPQSVFYYVDLYQFESIEGTEIYGIKYFPKTWRDHTNKYSVVLNKKWTINARKIINTILAICVDHYSKNTNASFVFFGERRPGECIEKTKRFNVYSIFASFFISENSFLQYCDEDSSTYLLLNNSTLNIDCTVSKIKKSFSNYLEQH